jgi:hypothetical protein
MTMKTLLTTVALAATVISFPAVAEPGCQWGNPMNDLRASDCDEQRGYVYGPAYGPAPWYASGAYIGYGSYAYVPQRRVGVRARFHESIDDQTRLKGGAD